MAIGLRSAEVIGAIAFPEADHRAERCAIAIRERDKEVAMAVAEEVEKKLLSYAGHIALRAANAVLDTIGEADDA